MFQEFIEILILSAVQGISEFLPISSSAHLILVSNLYDLKSSSFFNDFRLNVKDNDLLIGINIKLQDYRNFKSVVVKLYFTIALPSTSTPPEDCGIDCVTIEGTPPEPAFVL